jgi:acetyl esterase
MKAATREGMQAFIDTAARFRSATDDWSSRRDAFARQCAHFTRAARRPLKVIDKHIGGVMTRCFMPDTDAPERGWPVLLLFHGGGWTSGSHTTHDWFAHSLLDRADLAIVVVDYRLAPEFHFPAPLDDGLAVWDALGETSLSLDAERCAIAGDSAGGTLAAALCVALSERGHAQPLAQVLIYPVLSAETAFPSISEFADAPMLSARSLADSIGLYIPDERDRRLPLAMPLNAVDLAQLAPALIAVAMEDVLRDQCFDYAARLCRAGVRNEVLRMDGLVHGGLRATELTEVAACYDRIAAFLINENAAADRRKK